MRIDRRPSYHAEVINRRMEKGKGGPMTFNEVACSRIGPTVALHDLEELDDDLGGRSD